MLRCQVPGGKEGRALWEVPDYLYSRNSLDPFYLVPHYYLGHIPSLFGSRWVVGYQVVGVLSVPRIVAWWYKFQFKASTLVRIAP